MDKFGAHSEFYAELSVCVRSTGEIPWFSEDFQRGPCPREGPGPLLQVFGCRIIPSIVIEQPFPEAKISPGKSKAAG